MTIAEILKVRTDRSGGPDACWPWTRSTNRRDAGYGRFTKNGVDILAHRAAWELANGEKLGADDRVLHDCDNPVCCNPKHLLRGTQKDNVADMVRKGRRAPTIGERHPGAILTDAQVVAIFLDPQPRATLARQYSVGKSTIGHIQQRTHWAHLTGHLMAPVRLDGRRERWRKT